MSALMQRRQTVGSCRSAFAPPRVQVAARRRLLRVRADAAEAAPTTSTEKSATYFKPVYDIEKIKTILPHR